MTTRLTNPILAVLLAHGSLQAADLNVLQSTEVDPAALNFSSVAATFARNINGRSYQGVPLCTLNG